MVDQGESANTPSNATEEETPLRETPLGETQGSGKGCDFCRINGNPGYSFHRLSNCKYIKDKLLKATQPKKELNLSPSRLTPLSSALYLSNLQGKPSA